MRIVNRTEFLKLPAGTLFCKFQPNLFDDLQIKECDPGTWNPDFIATTIAGSGLCLQGGDSSDQEDIVFKQAVEKGTEFRIDYESTSRDGYFDEDQLFAVYDKEDIQILIEKLKTLLPRQ